MEKLTRDQIKENKKKEILKLINKNIVMSTTKIASRIKADKYRANELLEELLKEKKIRRIQMNNFTFWESK